MDIIVLKLITGEEVLGELESQSETEFVLVNPVGISIVRGQNGQPNVGLTPFPMHAEQKTGTIVPINKKHVVYNYEPAEDFKANYNQIFGTGIVTPPEKKLILG
jgi:hypothetical protein